MSEEQRIFEPAEYPIEIDIYDAFLKYEIAEYDYFLYGTNPEDWHPSYLLFEAGYKAGKESSQ